MILAKKQSAIITSLIIVCLCTIIFASNRHIDKKETVVKPTIQNQAIGTATKKQVVTTSLTAQPYSSNKAVSNALKNTRYLATQQVGIIGSYAGKQLDNPADNTFSININRQLNCTDQVWLCYELTGVEDYTNIACSVNDQLAMGGYLVNKNNSTTKQRVQLNALWIKKGENHIQFGLPTKADYGYKISNLSIEIENKTLCSPLIVNAGHSTYNGKAYIHGFIRGDKKLTKLTVDGETVITSGGEFESIVALGNKKQVEVKATLSDGKTITRLIEYSQQAQLDKEYALERSTQNVSKIFEKGKSNILKTNNAQLVVDSNAVLATKKLSITTLRDMDLPALDMGITNVTDGNRGFRFLPHGEHFSKGATVALKYDRTKIPSGYTENDIRTYYFDTQSHHWVALERDSINRIDRTVISRTTHFTDMINGVIKVPESPETQGFAPTMMNDIKAADPTAKMEIIAPPTANNHGSAGLSYSFEMPPARNGMSPNIGIQYNSDGGSGWLGEGWDLNVPSISVDTRWGVPRYNDTKETETYNMAGTMLVTTDASGKSSVAHRGEKISRIANRQFYPRTEGSFSRIIRKGNSPSNYSWVVTDKSGTIYTYGGDDAVLKGTIQTIDGKTKEVIVEWKLKRVQELHGDYIEYNYETVDETVREGLTAKALYLTSVNAGNKGTDPQTVVTFTSDSLKTKQTNNARYGFLVSNNKLLNKVTIAFEGETLRSYVFAYKQGAFNTTILDKATHLDNVGAEVASHTFDYYDDVQSATGYVPFKSQIETWDTKKDDISSGFINSLTRLGIPGFNNQASALGGSETNTFGASLYLGFGAILSPHTKAWTGGGSFSYSYAKTNGMSTLIDINGDGLLDKVSKIVKVPFLESALYFRPNITTSKDSIQQFGDPIKIEGAELFSVTNSNSTSYGGRFYLGVSKVLSVNGGIDHSTTYTNTPIYFSDVNNDGLIDIVNNGKVYFNHITYKSNIAVPSFSTSSSDTSNPIMGRGIIINTKTSEDLAEEIAEQHEIASTSPMQDVVRVWEAPFKGTIKIDGTVQLITPNGNYDAEAYEKADGVRVAIQVGATEKWNKLILKGDNINYDAILDNINIEKGQKVYFRVQSGNKELSNGAFDKVIWSPVISYTDAKRIHEINPDGQETYVYKATEGDVKSTDNITRTTADVPVQITGKFIKPASSNSITLKVFLSNDKFNADDSTLNENYKRQLVFEKFYHGTETINENVNIGIENKLHGQNFEFEVVSGADDSLQTNLAWEKVKWRPIINYTINGLTQTVNGTVNYSSILANQIFEGESFKLGITNTPKIKPLITFDGGDIAKYDLNGKITMCVKRADNYLEEVKDIRVVHGVVNDSIISFNLPPTLNRWVEYYVSNDTLASAISSAKALLYTLKDTTYTEEKTVNANVFTKRSYDGFGPMWRHWGQFVYNAAEGRFANPIDESRLEMPQDSAQANPLTLPFIPMTLDMTSKGYWIGQNENINLRGDTICAARLGVLDITLPYPYINMGPQASSQSCFKVAGTTADAPMLMTKSTSTDYMGGASIAGFGGTLNHANGDSKTRVAFTDINGDGYPDIIESNAIQLTNSRGGRDGEVIFGISNQKSKSSNNSVGSGGDAIHASTLVSGLLNGANTAARANNASDHAKGQNSIPISASYQWNNDESVETFLDVNGDGLPDKILSDKKVQLNLGYSFSKPIVWDLTDTDKGTSNSLNAGAGFGFDIGQKSFAGGYGIATTFSHTNYSMMDVNSDGLADKVRKDGDNVYVSFNLGNKFANEIRWNGTKNINKSTSTSESLNGAFTIPIPITLFFKFIINPSVSYSKTINRVVEEIRDVDGDGYPDIVSSDNDAQMTVQRSAIARTNKLKTVNNPFGGNFTLDYERSQATYDHPGGKWVMKSVTLDDGVHDDGVKMKTAFEYSKGRHERYEREFLGFGEVVTKSIDTENGDKVYRSSTHEFDVSNYYNQGNLLRTELADGNNKKFNTSENIYYDYKVTPKGDEYIFITEPDSCTYYNIAFSPLKYTKTAVYEGKNDSILANESFYIYKVDKGEYGELKDYSYSDKGKLGIKGTGAFNYKTSVEYNKNNLTKYILGLPNQVTVKGGDGVLYRKVNAVYDTNYADHLTQVTQTLDGEGNTAVIDMVYDKAGNITKKTMPANAKGERMWYKYLYDRDYNMYVEQVDDAFGYRSTLEDYDYRFGVPLTTRDENGYTMHTALDNLGRVSTITGPNEQAQGLPYTLKFTYHPQIKTDEKGITAPAYAVTQHYDPANPTDDIETVTFVDGFGRPLQVKKDGVITSTTNGTNPTDKNVMIVSGRAKFDAFGRVKAAYYPVTEEIGTKTIFNPAFDAVAPTKTLYDIMDRALSTTLPDNTITSMKYDIDTDNRALKTTVTDAMGGQQSSFTNGSGQTVKTEQYSGPDGTITTMFSFDAINQLLRVVDAKEGVTQSTYDMAGRRTQVVHPASGTTKMVYDNAGNLVSKQTANLLKESKLINYDYDYNRLKAVTYPNHPESNVKYSYGNANASFNRVGRLMLQEDGTGAQEFQYGRLGEMTQVTRTLIIPNQAIATYVTKWKYDSWNRLQEMVYPDQEKITYSYNTAGLLTGVRGDKAYSYNYVNKIGYDKFEQRDYMKYCNGAETTYDYNPLTRQLSNLQVWAGKTAPKQIMNNTYTYDAVSNVLSVTNSAAKPTTGVGGQMTHSYGYDGLYRLTSATGTYAGSGTKTANYQLSMKYDNLHNITSKKQYIEQKDVQFTGTLKAGYDLSYNYAKNPQQISTLADQSYRTEGTDTKQPTTKNQEYTYDDNGNLIYINTQNAPLGSKGVSERKLLWDEENRLLALSDNGFVSNYWYDAAGERTVKTSGDGEGVFVNSVFSGGRTGTANFTAYVNPYLVVSPGGNYTKHIYVGSQRIVSKLGDLDSYGADPRRIEYAGTQVDGSKIDYKVKYTTSIQNIKDRYAALNVPYNGKDNNDYVNGLGFCCATAATAPGGIQKVSAANDNPEKLQYYYHSDHLGSSSLITDLDCNVAQHIEYVPFGEVFIEEKNSTWNTPYKFNGKELDEETGLYYYGARYMDPRTSVWISVDPLAERMPWNSPYVYCSNNPVNKIDPDGRLEWPVNRTYNGNGRRHENNWHAARPHGRLHKGVDVNHTGGRNTDQGAPIVATHNGTVTRIGRAGDGDGGGNRIKITSADGTVSTSYMHLNAASSGLKVGSEIKEGQQIGTMGRSGANGQSDYTAHLHYEVSVDGTKINPANGANHLVDPQQIIDSRTPTQQSERIYEGGALPEVPVVGHSPEATQRPLPQIPVTEIRTPEIRTIQN